MPWRKKIEQGDKKRLPMGYFYGVVFLKSDRVIKFTIGPYHLDKNATPVVDRDAGYWIEEVFRRFYK